MTRVGLVQSLRMGVFVRGLAMGAVETMPGVSGGTVAFITGIYDELVKSIASFSGGSLAVLLRDGWRDFARRHNLGFLVVLGAGMVLSLVFFANLLQSLLESREAYVMGFFFGLIAASVVHVGAESTWRWLATAGLAGLVLGLVVGVAAGTGSPTSDPSSVAVFVAGALAATAWILPGVSGAFVLVLLGLYEPMLAAVTNADLSVLATFVAGMVVGLVLFSKGLAWLLGRAHAAVLAVLTGFMAGSLIKLWPWNNVPVDDTVVAGVVATTILGVVAVALLAIGAHRKRALRTGALHEPDQTE